jgi:site-specific DNA-methyltransferase (adenine-specific)
MKLKDWDGIQTDVVINAPMEEVIAKMVAAGTEPDVVITSPPYGVGQIPSKGGSADKRVKTKNLEYDKVKDDFNEESYETWLKTLVKVAPLVFWNVPAKQGRPFGTDKVKPFGQIVWTKSNGTIPFANKGVIYAHEHIWLFGDPERLTKPLWSVWNFASQRLSKHPAPFPPALAARAIQYSTQPGDLVFDPFGGSGTTAATAKVMGRRYITCDVSAEYCSWIEERVKNSKPLMKAKEIA